MSARSFALRERVPPRAVFYVVKQGGMGTLPGTVTVLRGVPSESEELGAFDSPNRAIDFAEAVVRELNGSGAALEMVDPPYGLVGAG